MRHFTRRTAALAIAALVLSSQTACTDRVWQARFLGPDSPDLRAASPDAPYLKAHGTDGSVTVLEHWSVDPSARTLSGRGRRFDADRRLASQGTFTLAFDEVALVETNRPEMVKRNELAVMGVVAGASLVVTALCLTNPKACFGSCPTFYAGPGGAGPLVAEGFSASIARSLEETDVDAIDLARPLGDRVELTMRNEALETHLVRHVRLLAVPRPPGGRVYRAGERFLPTGREHEPLACAGADGDCLEAVRRADEREYLSSAGATDLAEEEVIELTFPHPAGPAGLIVRARNSLLNTFVFYQGLAWLGRRAGDAFARLQAAPPGEAAAVGEWSRLLGRAEVEVLAAEGWVVAGPFGEVGPIARETELVPLPAELAPGPVRVRLRLTRGNWKVDRLAVAELAGPPLVPVALEPTEVRRGGRADEEARTRLSGQGPRLVSSPGDAWALTFPLPAELTDAELFLESRGYYLEWIREQWLTEEDPSAAVALLRRPREALRRLAPAYKRVEPEVERIFWSSRIGEAP